MSLPEPHRPRTYQLYDAELHEAPVALARQRPPAPVPHVEGYDRRLNAFVCILATAMFGASVRVGALLPALAFAAVVVGGVVLHVRRR